LVRPISPPGGGHWMKPKARGQFLVTTLTFIVTGTVVT
jgi:hypothetical protein